MDVYHVYDAEALDLARDAMRPGWWQAYGVRYYAEPTFLFDE